MCDQRNSEQTYVIVVKTERRYAESSTNASFQIQLVGQNAETEWADLGNMSEDKFQQGQTDRFKITVKNVGRPIVIRLRLDHKDEEVDVWSGEMIKVKTGDDVDCFPLYDWVKNFVEIANDSATLPQNLSGVLKQQRENELQEKKSRFVWMKKEKSLKLPRILEAESYAQLPRVFQLDDVKDTFFKYNAFIAKENSKMEIQENFNNKPENFDFFKNLFDHEEFPPELPEYTKDWEKDEEFGRQMLDGINARMIERCIRIPEDCNITNDHVKNLLGGRSLDEEIAAGKMYMINYFHKMESMPTNNRNQLGSLILVSNALALFHSNQEGKLMPVAIQLRANDPSSIYTPNDEKYDWLQAKIHIRCVDSVCHEWISHLLLTHLFLEPIGICVFRCLPRCHPVHKLLRPHIHAVIPINQFARETLIAEGSVTNTVLPIEGRVCAAMAFETFTYDDVIMPKVMEKNGVSNKKLLPNYHYRDDMMMLWEEIREYVADVIETFYSDQDVKADTELQGWIREIATEGFGWIDGDTKGMPTSFKNVEQLVDFCTNVIGTSSVQHAAVNYGQFDMYKFIPNAPMGLRTKLDGKGQSSLQSVLDSLPDPLMAITQIGFTFNISQYYPNEAFLGEFPLKLFSEDSVEKAIRKFQRKLAKCGEKIEKRNKDLKYPYDYLIPSKIPACTTV